MIGVGFGFHFHCALLFLLGRKNSEELREELRYDCEFLERERERESGKLREGGGGVWILWKLESGKGNGRLFNWDGYVLFVRIVFI